MKKTSAGIIITDARYILVGHATGKPIRHGYDIFKGSRQSAQEKWIDAALRELKEESGIVLSRDGLQDFGKFKYTDKKNLRLFVYRSLNVKKEFDPSRLVCTETLEDGRPEMDGFRIIALPKVHLFLYRSLSPIVFNIVSQLPKGIYWDE